MITKTTGYQAGNDDKIHTTIEEAQVAEVSRIFGECNGSGSCESERLQEIASELVHTYKQEIIDILTTGPKSKPKARSINGGKKTRKAKPLPGYSQSYEELQESRAQAEALVQASK